MTLYLDSSALLKLYLDEPESDSCLEIMNADMRWRSGRHTMVEVRRNLHRDLTGRALASAIARFSTDWAEILVVDLDEAVCETAAQVAEVTGVRSLDALHLGAAKRVQDPSLGFLTYDFRQAQAARSLGLRVLGA